MKKFALILSATLFLVACGGTETLQELEKQEADIQAEIKKLNDSLTNVQARITAFKENSDSNKTESYPQVRLLTVTPGEFMHTVDIQGVINTDNNITLSAENGGKVMRVYVKEGQNVVKGQRLVDLDGSVIESNLAELRTRMSLAKQTYEKQQRLWEKQIGTEMQYLQAKNNYEALKNQEATLSTQLDKFQLRAPVNGVVDAVMVNLGEVTAPGMPVVRVVNLNDLEVVADVSEKYVGAFKTGDKVEVYFPALKDTLSAKITAIGQVINTNNRTFTMHVAIESKDTRLKPNLLAIIQATDFRDAKGISVPSNLVQTMGNEKFIMVAVQQDTVFKADKRNVVTGLSSHGTIYVLSGLQDGDQVITEGHLNVEVGDIVQPK
ncbi:MAG TPA: hypothetical protein DIW47_04735 [Bacteroidetes bacterium]|nr:hypothetical protein [Bacteroidota bacterium]